MKTKTLHRQPATISNARWAAYATAGAASAFSGANSAEATSHYSGNIGEFIAGRCDPKSVRFQLDQPGDSFLLRQSLVFDCSLGYGGFAHFGVRGLAGASFAGFYCPSYPQIKSVSHLNRGQLISNRPFLAHNYGLLAGTTGRFCSGQFGNYGHGTVGFIGFKFNNVSGDQYGWVRVKFRDYLRIDNDFWLMDYAYADPDEPIRAGQTSSNEMVRRRVLLAASPWEPQDSWHGARGAHEPHVNGPFTTG